MPIVRKVAVIDIGKTNAKVALVDLDAMSETVVATIANAILHAGPYPHFDTERLWSFVVDGLGALAGSATPDAIIVTTHAASAALLAEDGTLALPVLDYEHPGPDSIGDAYDALRPDFAETGSPRLPGGLNLGAQLFWQARAFPEAFARASTILTYPQYWARRLCGVAANEATSLGSHTDLWNPTRRDFSSLIRKLGWDSRMAPVRHAADRLGPILPEIATRTGLPEDTLVFCGIHDSNASLYAHLLARRPPFSVVSTGTWVIVMAIGGASKTLDPSRDTLINVDALGDATPSARFMGGREFSLLLGDAPVQPTEAEMLRVLATPCLLTPSIEQGSGPFQGREAQWLPNAELTRGESFAVVSFYLALMTATCLDLAGAQGATIVEGPFATNACFTKMLAMASGRPVVASKGGTGTCIGAALLCAPQAGPPNVKGAETNLTSDAGWDAYARRWRTAVGLSAAPG